MSAIVIACAPVDGASGIGRNSTSESAERAHHRLPVSGVIRVGHIDERDEYVLHVAGVPNGCGAHTQRAPLVTMHVEILDLLVTNYFSREYRARDDPANGLEAVIAFGSSRHPGRGR